LGQWSIHKNPTLLSMVDYHGQKIGKLQDVSVDVETDEPQFAAVKEGFIDRHLTFVPVGGTKGGLRRAQVSVGKELVKPRRTSSSTAKSSPKRTSQLYTATTSSTTPRPTPRADAAPPAVDST
jgi:hypothetical protein